MPSPAARASDGVQWLGGSPAATPSTLWPSTPSPTIAVACAADLSFPPPCWMALPCEDGLWEALAAQPALLPAFGQGLPLPLDAALAPCVQPLPVLPPACPADRGPGLQAGQDAAAFSAAEDTDAARAGRPAPSHSLGSAGHGTGECKPCAWYYKPQGCSMGSGCDFCHLCDAGEIKIRKKAKAASLRQGPRR